MDSTRVLKEIYEDKDGQRKEEVALLSGPNEFVEFYNRLKQIKEFYKKHPNEVIVVLHSSFHTFSSVFVRLPSQCQWSLTILPSREKPELTKQTVSFDTLIYKTRLTFASK